MQLSSLQEPISRREDCRSPLCDQLIRALEIEECIREVYGPPHVTDFSAQRFNEVLHRHRNHRAEHGVLRQIHNSISH